MDEIAGSPGTDPEQTSPAGISTQTYAPVHRVFIGNDGLRAGWRLVLYLVGFFALLYVLILANRLLLAKRAPGPPPIWFFLLGECESFAAAVIPALVLARIEKRPFGIYGLPGKGAFGKRFWMGVVWGFCAISALLLVMRGVGAFYYGGFALHGFHIAKFAVFWGVLFLMVGFFEEFVTRGYTQFTLTQGIGFWPAAALLSAAFGVIHLGNKGEAWAGALAAALIGLFFCLTLRRTGNLWFAVGMHASWDWGESFLYSVPDSGIVVPGHLLKSSFHGPAWLSGGSVGPEGSAMVFILIPVLWLLFDRLYPQVRYQAEAAVAPAVPTTSSEPYM